MPLLMVDFLVGEVILVEVFGFLAVVFLLLEVVFLLLVFLFLLLDELAEEFVVDN